MSNSENLEKLKLPKVIDKNSNFFSRQKSNKNNTKLTTIGALLNIIWFLTIFINPPLSPQDFVVLGGLSLLFTLFIKIFLRLRLSPDVLDLQGGGSIVGFVITWILVQFYPLKSSSIAIFGESLTVNQILNYYLVIIFLIWFFIPSKSPHTQELIFNLHPLISYFLLNLWKLLIILLVIAQIWNVHSASTSITALLLIVCIFELVGMFQRILKIEIADIILDLPQLIVEIIKGPAVSIKWIFLIIVFLVLGQIQSNIIVLAVLGFSILMGFISITTFISKLTIDSGLIERKSNQALSAVPQIFSDLKELQVEDFHSNYFQVTTNFELKRKTKLLRYSLGDTLFRLPLKPTLESMTGIYVAKFSFSTEKKPSKRQKRHDGKNLENNLQIKSISSFKEKEWNDFIQKGYIKSISSDIIINEFGISSTEEFDRMIEKRLKNFSKFQDNVRDRIRGVPATYNPGKIYNLDSITDGIPVPEELIQDLKNQGIHSIEIIPGKDEYLYYVKKKN